MEHKQDESLAAVIELGIAEGRLPHDEDVAQAAAQIVGPLLFAQLSGKPPITEQFAQKVVDDYLRARAVAPA